MSTNGRPRRRSDSPERQPYPGPRLETAVVQYDGRPDRCTIYPADSDAADRLTTWVSVDQSVVRSLDAMR